MNDLIDTTQMYLRTVYELLEEGVAPKRARIVERLHHSGPTVSQTVARMERDGLLRLTEDRLIELTPVGLAEATRVMRRHRLAETLLVSMLGLGLDEVHEEACRWEHVMSDRVAERFVEVLGDPHTSPYGTPIPPAQDDRFRPQAFLDGLVSLVEALDASDPLEAELGAFGERVQADDYLLGRLLRAGVRPGVNVRARSQGHLVEVGPGDGRPMIGLSADVAQSLFLRRP